jgi:hypothetical protein
MKAARKTFKSLDVENYALTLETSFEHWNSDYHAHAHALVEIPTGGRSFISRDRWDDAWHDSLPAELHAVDTDGAAHVRPVRDLESTCHYLHKTPFLKLVAEREAAARMVATILETKGLRRRESRGSLAATETEQCAA